MCGIAGFTHGHRAAPSGRIQSAVATIIHRGPNQQGVFESETVSLGAARLKIIDIEGGDQPIVSEDGGTAYMADSSPGDVYAVRLPSLTVAWKHHVGGAPFGLLLHGGSLFVSLFSGGAVVELDPADGAQHVRSAVGGNRYKPL